MAMLRVANCPSQDLALTNAAFVNEADAAFVPYAELGDLVLFNVTHRDEELQVFGQERWEEAIRTHQQRSQVIRVRVKIMGLIIINS